MRFWWCKGDTDKPAEDFSMTMWWGDRNNGFYICRRKNIERLSFGAHTTIPRGFYAGISGTVVEKRSNTMDYEYRIHLDATPVAGTHEVWVALSDLMVYD